MKLFIFGLGFTSRAFVRLHGAQFQSIVATTRGGDQRVRVGDIEIGLHRFADGALDERARRDLAEATHVLVSIPPGAHGDPALQAGGAIIAGSSRCEWIGYLSSVAVYGDRGGAWTDEQAALNATSARGKERIGAEQAWIDLGARAAKPVGVFRLAGIYGPGRNAIVNLRAGKAKRLVKPGQVFNRIHVDDISHVVWASMAERAGGVWNVADDEPSPPQDVVTYAAGLLGVAPPPEIPFESERLSPMAASFYADNKRIANGAVKRDLKIALRYPTYREGLRALVDIDGKQA